MKTNEIKFTREERIKMAKAETKTVAEMKDWRITNQYNRQQLEAARRLMAAGGYKEMTQAEAHAIDPEIDEYVSEVKFDQNGNAYTERERADKEVKIWGYMWNSVWKKIQLTSF